MLAGKTITENVPAKNGRERQSFILVRTRDTEFEDLVVDDPARAKVLQEADTTLELLRLQNLNEIVVQVQSIIKEDLREKRADEVRGGIVESKKTLEMCKRIGPL